MQYAEISKTGQVISAQQASLMDGSEEYRCPSCGVEVKFASLVSPMRAPYFRLAPGMSHNLDCEFNGQGGRRLKGIEFESFLASALKAHGAYSNVEQDFLLGQGTRYRADILASRVGGGGERLLIECKTSPPNSLRQLDQLLRQLFAYGTTNNDYKIVLAVPATLSDEYLFALKEAGVEVWDLNFLSREFSGVIHKIPGSYFAQIIVSHANRSHEPTNEEKFISSLRSCLPGKQDCYVYQKLIGEILGHLFTPPLYEPIPELSDKAKVNRRDFIMPNYVDSGFWAFLRERYSADYVVIDAKNYTKKVSKKDVLQIANYLKSHGAGLFGLIISRRGGDLSGCEVTLREQWLVHQKMIIILDDEDVVSMLLAKSDGRAPEQVIGSKIEQFRLSM
ncbi:TPA: hypothetical protein ACXNRD_002562 [Pseudomonas aeruginosa]